MKETLLNRNMFSTVVKSFVIILCYISYINGSIQCFCTNQHCEERITCNGEYCLVGLSLKAGKASLEQMCVDHTVDMPESCSQNWNGFTEVCSCDKEYCNTFVFLRASIDTRQQEEIENLEMLGAGNSKTYDSSRDRSDYGGKRKWKQVREKGQLG